MSIGWVALGSVCEQPAKKVCSLKSSLWKEVNNQQPQGGSYNQSQLGEWGNKVEPKWDHGLQLKECVDLKNFF